MIHLASSCKVKINKQSCPLVAPGSILIFGFIIVLIDIQSNGRICCPVCIDAVYQQIPAIYLRNAAIRSFDQLILTVAGTNSTEAIAVTAHINTVRIKGEIDRDICCCTAALSCQTCCGCSCCILLYQIGNPILCSTCRSTPVSFIGKHRSLICYISSNSVISSGTRFAILVSINHLTINIRVISIRVHCTCTAVHDRRQQPQTLGRSHLDTQAVATISYLKIICSFI